MNQGLKARCAELRDDGPPQGRLLAKLPGQLKRRKYAAVLLLATAGCIDTYGQVDVGLFESVFSTSHLQATPWLLEAAAGRFVFVR